ncbi:MAG: ligase-associated DNA damage response endonuclease PdeM [Betaproteobacteria bacterium]
MTAIDGVPGGDLPVQVAGETLLLMPERVAAWPARRTLLVADAHFGKAASFRALGVPVPAGTTEDNLAGLDAAVARAAPERIVFLGDFLHSRLGRAPDTLDALHAWRARHAGVAMVVVRGNHDRHAGDPPPGLGIDVVDEPLRDSPFLLCHHPREREGGYVLAGHLHPAIRLRGRGRDRLTLRCFHFAPSLGVLPAFGAFTGRALIEPAAEDRVFVITGAEVLRIPACPAGT